jgi:serine/threonine-protein kinase
MDVAEQQIGAGEQIGPYVVSRRLGAGGMGEVYLARHRHLDRDAAVKVLLPEISLNKTVVSRFFTEARATAQLRHANIVEIFDCDVLPDGRAYIVMEYLRGESLRQTLDRVGRLAPAWESIAAITGMVADALHAAHENGIVHRDLKPDNTYLSAQRGQRAELTVKVLDFGIAKLLSGGSRSGASVATRTGSLIGTPLYMSPEQCRGVPTIDHRADIYSLGCMAYEMVVGQPPFVAEAPGDILIAHMLQQPPPLSTFDASVPETIDALVAMMLAKDPAGRPQSMAEVVATCQALLGVSKSDFATVLRPPPGFPEQVQAATQILPASATPVHATPIGATPRTPLRQTPAPPRPSTTPQTEIDEAAPPEALPSRPQRTPVRTGGRRAPTGEPERSAGATVETVGRPKWLLPVAIIVPLVVLGMVGAYLLSRPQPLPGPPAQPATNREPPPAPEPAPRPAGFVPPAEPTTTPPPREPELREPAPSREAQPAEADKADRKPSKKKPAGGKKPEGGSPFKAVGD